MKNKILWIVTFLPTIVTLIVVQFIPASIPMHSDLAGNIDRWGSKYESFIFPVMIIALTLFWQCFLRYYNKKKITGEDEKVRREAESNGKVIYVVAIGMAILFSIMHYFILYSSIMEAKNNLSSAYIDINFVTNTLLGIFFIVIGSYMLKCKLNSTVGVRTPWSMKNDKVWADANRFGGKSMIVSGILVVLETIFIGGFTSTLIMIGIVIIDGIVSIIYSYKVYNKYEKSNREI